MATERARELRAEAAAERLARRPPIPKPPGPAEHAVTIRHAFPDDAPALRRLAALDSSEPPPAPVLVAEVDGRLRAALSLSDGALVADPFHPTRGLTELLSARARQLGASRQFTPPIRRRPAVLVGILRKVQARW